MMEVTQMKRYNFDSVKYELQDICSKVNQTLKCSPFAPDMTSWNGCYLEIFLLDVLGSSFKIQVRFHLWYAHYDADDCDHRYCDEAMRQRMECAIDRLNRNMRKWLKKLDEMYEIWSDNIESNFFGAFVDTGCMGIQDCNTLEIVLRLK